MSDVFISYAKEDRNRVKRLAEALAEAHGWSVWWDREIPFGRPYAQVIEQALSSARCVVVVWSKFSIKSSWVQEEAQEGLIRQILVPVLVDDVPPPLGFRSIQGAELFKWDGAEDSAVFSKLLADIASLCTEGPYPAPKINAPESIEHPGLAAAALARPPEPTGERLELYAGSAPAAAAEPARNSRRDTADAVARPAHEGAKTDRSGVAPSRPRGLADDAPARPTERDARGSRVGSDRTGYGGIRVGRKKAVWLAILAILVIAGGWAAHQIKFGFWLEPSSSLIVSGREIVIRGGRSQSITQHGDEVMLELDGHDIRVTTDQITVDGDPRQIPRFARLVLSYKVGHIWVEVDGREIWHLPVRLADQAKSASPAAASAVSAIGHGAVTEEDSEEQLETGNKYYFGEGVEKDYVQAANWYRMAAEQGHATAQFNLGVMYAHGRGVPKDDDEAVKWYRMAAEQGDAGGQTNLGAMYAEGRGVAEDQAEAVKWYRMAAEQGHAIAQNVLGASYANGDGVAKSEVEAIKWIRRAAEQGYGDAQKNLGVMYANGRGVSADDAEAIKWFREAAEQGHATAQFNLAVMHAKGRGVRQDDDEAVKWFREAAKRGSSDAQEQLRRRGLEW